MKKIIILIFLITLSCSNNKVVRNHGQYALDIKINKVEINKSNKNDIVEIFGKPSTISLFDDNIWYYIQREKVNQSLFKLGKSKIKKNIVLEINFNDYGIVDNKLVYLIDDMNDIKIVSKLYFLFFKK